MVELLCRARTIVLSWALVSLSISNRFSGENRGRALEVIKLFSR